MAVAPPKVYPDIYSFLAPENFKDVHAGKLVLITGAGGDIAQQIAKHFALAGATLAVTDISLEKLDSTVELCRERGAEVAPFACDISKESGVQGLIKAVQGQLGDIDILVNAAGVCTSKPIFLDSFASIWREVEINLGGVLLTTLNVLPSMKARGRGCIINLASRAGTVTVPYLAGYSISKAGVIKATENLQKDLDADGLGDNIQLYCCHPGAVLTRLSKRPMDPVVVEAYPRLAAGRPKWLQNYRTAVDLCAAACVFVATGRVKDALRGRYIDCEHDLEAFLSPEAAKEITENDLHVLKVDFLGGLPNDGGTSAGSFRLDSD